MSASSPDEGDYSLTAHLVSDADLLLPTDAILLRNYHIGEVSGQP